MNDTCTSISGTPGCATTSVAPGSGNPGSPILASTSYGNANNNPADLFGTMHYKNGFGGNSQRILELDLKYSF